MKKIYFMFFACIIMWQTASGQSIEFWKFSDTAGGTALYSINDSGFSVGLSQYYDYANSQVLPVEPGISMMMKINNQNDVAGRMNYGNDGVLQAAYRKNSIWSPIGFFSGEPPLNNGAFGGTYSISNNSRYVVGQISSDGITSNPFIFDTQTNLIAKINNPENVVNARANGVNDSGITVGYVDRPDLAGGSTFRLPVYFTPDGQKHYMMPDVPGRGEAFDINNAGQIVGSKGTKLFIYDLNTGEYQLFDSPNGLANSVFMEISENGIAIGYAGDVFNRRGIIYHPQLGSNPMVLEDVLIAKGVQFTTFDGNLGTAMAISPDGNFITGFDNHGPTTLSAVGWIVNLNDQLFSENDCVISCPNDIQINLVQGQTSEIVNYELPIVCDESSPAGLSIVLIDGLASGSEFPIGETMVTHNLVDAEGNILYVCSFKVTVNDSYCNLSPVLTDVTIPITNVKFGGIDNDSPSETTIGHEYFLDTSADVTTNVEFALSLETLNTYGLPFIAGVYIDWNQNFDFTDEDEFYNLGSIVSDGSAPAEISTNIIIPTDAAIGSTRMRVVMQFDLGQAIDPCDTTNFLYGQVEDYTVNVSESDIDLVVFPFDFSQLFDINDDGFAINPSGYYDYYTEEFTSIEPEGKSMYRINNNGDVIGDMVYLETMTQPGYKKDGAWNGIGYFVGDVPESGWFASGMSISENSKYVTGQISVGFIHSYPFIYDTETNTLTKLSHPEYENGRGQGVNDNGITVGWVDRDDLVDWGTFRVPVYYTADGSINYIDFDTPEGGEAWDINNAGQIVGHKGGKPFIYDINTDTYQSFTLPQNMMNATFLSVSDNGIAVGYGGDLGEREVIIYHPSLGSGVLLLKDILTAKGVEITTFDQRLGTATGISQNGNFICGFDNAAPIFFAKGWIINLNNLLFSDYDCTIACPSDIVMPPVQGAIGAIVNYDLPITCDESSPDGLSIQLIEGLPSGSEFPIGVTQVKHHLVDASGNIIYVCTFTVTVEDTYCGNAPLYGVVPITNVKFGSIDNPSSPTSLFGHEYFLNMPADVAQGSTHELTMTADTTHDLTYIAGVYIDWNNNGDFTDEGEFYDLGDIISNGSAPANVSTNITVPSDAELGYRRMRVMMKYDWNTPMAPLDPCEDNDFYVGQVEDYTINITEDLAVSDLNSAKLTYYPNPVKDLLNISYNKNIENVTIYDLSGKQVYTQSLSDKNVQINIAHLSSGAYIVKASIDGEIKTFKILKK